MTAGRGRPPYWRDTLVLPASRPEGIHERDWDVLLARRSGLSQQQIADRLGITATRVAQIERRGVSEMRRWYRQPDGQAWLRRRQEIHEAASGGNSADEHGGG